MPASRRVVSIPLGPLHLSGVVPAGRALVFDARRGRWILRREDAAPASPGPSPEMAPVVARAGSPGRRRPVVVLGMVGALVGLAASASLSRFGPVVRSVQGGSLPQTAARAGPTVAGPPPSSASGALPGWRGGEPVLPVPAFVLQAAGGQAGTAAFTPTLRTAKEPGASRALPSPAAPRARHGEARTGAHRAAARPGPAPADDVPILNETAGREVVSRHAMGAGTDTGTGPGTGADQATSGARRVERLVAVKDARTVLIPDARTGVPLPVRVGERLPSGATLVSVDPKTGRARTDRGVLELQ